MKKVITILLFTTVVFTGCNAVSKNIDNDTDNSIISTDFENEAIIAAANYMINLNSALNSNMHFIALEYKCDVCVETKELLINAFSAHCDSVFDASSVNLADSKYSDENGTLRGIKIIITKLQKVDAIYLSFTKKKSSVGAISSEVTLIKNADNIYQTVKYIKPTVGKISIFKIFF